MRKPRKVKKPVVPESTIVNACIRWLWANGCFIWRNNTGGYKPEGASRFIRFGLTGSADIIGVTPRGRFIAVECKREGKHLEPHQEAFAQKVIAHNGVFVLARSIDDLEAVKSAILN